MVNILLVLGDQKGINPKITKNDILVPRSLGARRFLLDPTVIENPTQDEFREIFRSKSFDILIVVGHTNMNDDGRDGTITINDGIDKNGNNVSSSISMGQFEGVFNQNVRNPLKLVILAGCCSDGAARQLTVQIGVSKVIAFRMPIAASVIRVFFEELFHLWIRNSLSLQLAMGETRKHLKISDPDSPGASGTPILLTSSDAAQDLPLMFSKISRSSLQGRLLDPLLSIPLISTLLDKIIRLKYLRYLLLLVVSGALASAFAWWIITLNSPPKIACDIPNI